MTRDHASGEKPRNITLYGLSTCGWCRRTKKLLDDLGVEYNLVYVDLLRGNAREEAIEEVASWNPGVSFPTVVVDNEIGIVGFKEDEVREAVGK